MKHVLKQLTVMCCTIGQNHFIHHDHLGYNMTKPATWLTVQNLPRLIILIADLVKNNDSFYLFCHVLALIVLVLQVGVKNIPNHNNHVPFGQLRDLTAN